MNENKFYFSNKNESGLISLEDKESPTRGQNDSSTYLGDLEIRSVTYFLLKKKPYLSGYISESIISVCVLTLLTSREHSTICTFQLGCHKRMSCPRALVYYWYPDMFSFAK